MLKVDITPDKCYIDKIYTYIIYFQEKTIIIFITKMISNIFKLTRNKNFTVLVFNLMTI